MSIKSVLDKLYRKACNFSTSNMTEDINQSHQAILAEVGKVVSEDFIAQSLLETKDFWEKLEDCGKASLPKAGVKLFAQELHSKIKAKLHSEGL